MRRALPFLVASFLALAVTGTAEAKHRHGRSCGHSHGYVSYYSSPGYVRYYYEPQPVVVYRPYYRPTYVRYYRPYYRSYYHRRPRSYVSVHFSFGR